MSSQVQASRLTKELMSMERDPPPGIICHPVDDADMTHLEAYIKGPPDSPYEKGTFRLDIHIPSEYPFSPPTIKFKTMIYHPNVDDSGTICLNILKKSENDGWKPSLNIEASLKSIQVLMGEPNPNDPLDPEIAKEFQFDNALFIRKAKEFVQKYATGDQTHVDTVTQKPTKREKDDNTRQSQNDISTAERTNRSPGRKSKLSLSIKNRKPRTLSSSTNNEDLVVPDSRIDNTSSSSNIINIKSDTQTSCPAPSTSQYLPDEINIKDSNMMDQFQSVGCHARSSTAVSLNLSQKSHTQKPITNADDVSNDVDVDKGQALIGKKSEKTDNVDNNSQRAMGDKKEMDISDAKAAVILNESDDSKGFLHSLPQLHSQAERNGERPSSSSSSNDFKCSNIDKGDKSMECDSNMKSQTSAKTKFSFYPQQNPSLSSPSSSVFSVQKDEPLTGGEEKNVINIQSKVNVKEIVTGQHDCPVSKPSPINHVDCSMTTSAVTERKPLHDSQSSQNILDNDSSPPRDKGKGKAVCKSPPYTSSLFGKDYHQIFSATDDENYMPKKRTISACMKNKLSLSRSKRQRASNNSSFA